jgi:hypothetical protein
MSNNENPQTDGNIEGAEKKEVMVNQENNNVPSLPSEDFSTVRGAVAQLDDIDRLAEKFIGGALCPIKNKSDFTIAVITGNQLQLPFVTSINNIFPINGKPAMSTHLIRALLIKGGVTFNKDYDNEPMFNFFEGVKDAEGNLVAKKVKGKDSAGNEIEMPILRGCATLDQIDKEKYVPGNKEADRLTQYTFERMIKRPDGSFKTMTVVSRFKISEAYNAGLITESDKSAWNKYPARMLDARASTIGGREIAPDIIFGMHSISELADANGMTYSMSDGMEETLDAEFTEIKK